VARTDGRADDQARAFKVTPNYLHFAEGSALIEIGDTRVLCAATVEDRAPLFLKGQGSGWVTAEYALLPRSTAERTQREAVKGRLGGRTHEIQRIIGRSLRSVVDLRGLGERTILLDCDVLEADGGTRTASITGAFCALYMAIKRMKDARMVVEVPVRQYLAAVSCGIVDGTPMLDLDYAEDFHASTDLNCVMTEDGRIVELQATAEGAPYSRAELESMLALAGKGIKELIVGQKRAIAALG
jgi:ribonuclease PH